MKTLPVKRDARWIGRNSFYVEHGDWFVAVCAGLAARMATKYAPDRQQLLQGQADKAYANAAAEDRETVTMRILPDMSSYYT